MSSSHTDESGEEICGDAPVLIDNAAPSAAGPAKSNDEPSRSSAAPVDGADVVRVSNDQCPPSDSRQDDAAGSFQLAPSLRRTEDETSVANSTEGAAPLPLNASSQEIPGTTPNGKVGDEFNGNGNNAPAVDQPAPSLKKNAEEDPENEVAPELKSVDPSLQHDAEELNVSLQALETMRKLNLEVEFSASSLAFPVDHSKCTYCQREALHKFVTEPPKPPAAEVKASPISIDRSGVNIGKVKLDGSRLRKFRSNVGGLFKKASNTDAGVTSQSCPPSLASPSSASIKSMESGGEDATANTGDKATSIRPNGRRNILKRQPRPCLTCGHPTCSNHSSSTFFKNHIPICQPCAHLFELDFLVEVITSTASDPTECRRKVDFLVDCYDRAKLLLTFTAKYADEIASALETNTTRSNKIGAGSSATGIVSGVAGVVGCSVLLFPPAAAAGVPLLIASLVFGGGATAVQTGDAAANFFSEPNQLAEKMIALHGMVLSLLRITEVLSYGLLKKVNVNYSVEGFSEDKKDAEGEEEEEEAKRKREELKKEIHELLTKHGVNTTQASVGGLQSAVVGGIVATEVVAASAVAGAEATAAVSTGAMVRGASVVGRNTRYMGRVGTTAASGARFVPIAGGLLSAACVVVEGRELKRTLSRIGKGNPCEKAEQVRSIRDEVGMFPDSSLIAAECHRVFEMAEQQERLRKEGQDQKQDHDENEKRLTLDDVNAADIADMISVMETSTEIDGMDGNGGK